MESIEGQDAGTTVKLDAPRSVWQPLGACVKKPALFTAEPIQTEACINICNTCPVIGQCLNYALANNERHLVWGGMSPKDRQAYLRTNPSLDMIPIEYRDQYTELEGRVKRVPKASIVPPRNPALDLVIDQSFLDLIDSIDVSLLSPIQVRSLEAAPSYPIARKKYVQDAIVDLAS